MIKIPERVLTVVEEPELFPIQGRELEEKKFAGKRPSPGKRQKIAAWKQRNQADILVIWDFWREHLGKTARARLSIDREADIAWALQRLTIEEAKNVIRGCALSDWHMGRNPNNVRYDSIGLLFRDDDHIDMFLAKFYATNNTQW
jgi:hypothetical protein